MFRRLFVLRRRRRGGRGIPVMGVLSALPMARVVAIPTISCHGRAVMTTEEVGASSHTHENCGYDHQPVTRSSRPVEKDHNRRAQHIRHGNQSQSGNHAREEAVPLWLERGQVQKAGSGRVFRYDEDVVAACGQSAAGRGSGVLPMPRRGRWLAHGAGGASWPEKLPTIGLAISRRQDSR